MKAYVGQSPTLTFAVTSDFKCEQDKCTIYIESDSSEKVTDERFQVTGRKITLREVKKEDNNKELIICCRDHRGVEIEAKFTLEIAGKA